MWNRHVHPMSNGPVCRHGPAKTGHGPAKTGHGPGPENEVDTVPVRFRDMVFVKNKHEMYMFLKKNALRAFVIMMMCVMCNMLLYNLYVTLP